MSEKWKIDKWVDDFAATSFDIFYPTAVQKAVDISIDEVFNRLMELVSDGKLIMELEVRCPNCFSTLNYNNYDTNDRTAVCEDCSFVFDVDSSVVFPRFKVEQSYRDFIKKNQQGSKVQIYPKYINQESHCLSVM